MGLHSAYALDLNNVPIEAGTQFVVAEFTLATDSWTAITVPEGADCKKAFMRDRGGNDFKVSHLSDGSKFVTLPGAGFTLEIAKLAGNTICYAQATTGGTLEVLFIY